MPTFLQAAVAFIAIFYCIMKLQLPVPDNPQSLIRDLSPDELMELNKLCDESIDSIHKFVEYDDKSLRKFSSDLIHSFRNITMVKIELEPLLQGTQYEQGELEFFNKFKDVHHHTYELWRTSQVASSKRNKSINQFKSILLQAQQLLSEGRFYDAGSEIDSLPPYIIESRKSLSEQYEDWRDYDYYILTALWTAKHNRIQMEKAVKEYNASLIDAQEKLYSYERWYILGRIVWGRELKIAQANMINVRKMQISINEAHKQYNKAIDAIELWMIEVKSTVQLLSQSRQHFKEIYSKLESIFNDFITRV